VEINFFGKKTLASFVLTMVVNAIKIRFKQFELSDEIIWKAYYELNKLIERSPLKKITNKEEFAEKLVEVLDILEGEINRQTERDPDFVKKLMKKHSYLWDIYKLFSDYVTEDNVSKAADNFLLDEIRLQANNHIITDPALLDYKIKRDVDYAIQDYWEELRKRESS